MHCSSHFPAGLTETLWTILPDPTRRMRDPCKHPDNAASAVWHFTFSDPLWQVRHPPQSRGLDARECLNGGRFVVKGLKTPCSVGVCLLPIRGPNWCQCKAHRRDRIPASPAMLPREVAIASCTLPGVTLQSGHGGIRQLQTRGTRRKKPAAVSEVVLAGVAFTLPGCGPASRRHGSSSAPHTPGHLNGPPIDVSLDVIP